MASSPNTRASDVRLADELAERLDLLLQAAADRLAEREDALVDDPVVGEVALLAPRDDPAPLQHAEMLGDVLLRRLDQLGQLEHARLAVAEAVEQLDPGRLAQRAEALGDQLDQIIGKRVRDGHSRSPCSGVRAPAARP